MTLEDSIVVVIHLPVRLGHISLRPNAVKEVRFRLELFGLGEWQDSSCFQASEVHAPFCLVNLWCMHEQVVWQSYILQQNLVRALLSPWLSILIYSIGNTTCRMVDTGGHKPRHASNTRAVQVLINYPTGFPDCVGPVPNSMTTMLPQRTVKALDTGPSSCCMGHNGLDIDSAGTTILISFIHHTSVQSIGTYLLRHLSNIRVIPLSFCFISRLEGDQLNLLRASCNRWPSSVRIFQSSLGIYLYSAYPSCNSSSKFLSITNFEDNPSIQSLFDLAPYLSTTSAFLTLYLSPSSPRHLVPSLCGVTSNCIGWSRTLVQTIRSWDAHPPLRVN